MREDIRAHTIWTVVFASIPVVADLHHLRHYSFVLEKVEAQSVKVADAGVIARARYFLFQLFLFYLLVMELETILLLAMRPSSYILTTTFSLLSFRHLCHLS